MLAAITRRKYNVTNSLMPEGVEHRADAVRGSGAEEVTNSLMPEGVEHEIPGVGVLRDLQ